MVRCALNGDVVDGLNLHSSNFVHLWFVQIIHLKSIIYESTDQVFINIQLLIMTSCGCLYLYVHDSLISSKEQQLIHLNSIPCQSFRVIDHIFNIRIVNYRCILLLSLQIIYGVHPMPIPAPISLEPLRLLLSGVRIAPGDMLS